MCTVLGAKDTAVNKAMSLLSSDNKPGEKPMPSDSVKYLEENNK